MQPLRLTSQIGATRQTRATDGFAQETYPASYEPEESFSGHMTFALKYEGVYPEVLARLFARVPEAEISAWVMSERSGQYARRAGFLWEWFSGRELEGVPPVPSGNYVDAIDSKRQIAATTKVNNGRWRVRDNMPGTRDFCPLIFRTDRTLALERFNCAEELHALNVEYGADVLLRSAVWLTIKESRSSFQIEHEEKKTDDIKRFAAAMERRCGEDGGFLTNEKLTSLQHEVIGKKTTLKHFGVRQSPVFVGSVFHYENVVHYVAPHCDAVPAMLGGLSSFLARTAGLSSLVRAAAAAFGFVYIHPLADGNGRVHRFLINDVLRRDNAIPAPYILPISATIMHSPADRAKYDEVLDVFSKPFMRLYGSSCGTGKVQTYPDGIESDFVFHAYGDAGPAWRYPDFTSHVEYIGDVIERTIKQEMTNEARMLQSWGRARVAVKEVLDGPNSDIDRIIRSLQENKWLASNALKKQFPMLLDKDLVQDVIEAVKGVFTDEQDGKPLV
ncbi:Fic family protein [Chitinimonas arctica]|uniref:Fic family protein n=2 Tax=Chitinimonas arctica TaxID=2594795 RepID=A0A516SMA0_9NEIS|nr:Fic family protein [Chitinimonas arctica]